MSNSNTIVTDHFINHLKSIAEQNGFRFNGSFHHTTIYQFVSKNTCIMVNLDHCYITKTLLVGHSSSEEFIYNMNDPNLFNFIQSLFEGVAC